jgi:hypothetical protein
MSSPKFKNDFKTQKHDGFLTTRNASNDPNRSN